MYKVMLESVGTLGAVVAVLALFLLLPILTIWSANTLFPILNIPYNLETWSATVLLGIFFRGASAKK